MTPSSSCCGDGATGELWQNFWRPVIDVISVPKLTVFAPTESPESALISKCSRVTPTTYRIRDHLSLKTFNSRGNMKIASVTMPKVSISSPTKRVHSTAVCCDSAVFSASRCLHHTHSISPQRCNWCRLQSIFRIPKSKLSILVSAESEELAIFCHN